VITEDAGFTVTAKRQRIPGDHRAAAAPGRARACGHLVSDEVLRYLNRLPDLLFVLARHAGGDATEPVSHDWR